VKRVVTGGYKRTNNVITVSSSLIVLGVSVRNLTPDISVVNLQLVDHSCLNGERFIHRLIIATEMKPKMA